MTGFVLVDERCTFPCDLPIGPEELDFIGSSGGGENGLAVTDDGLDLVHVIQVLVTFNPFKHLVVGHHFLKQDIAMFAFEPQDCILAVGSGLPSDLSLNDLGTSLLPVVVRVADESSPHNVIELDGWELVIRSVD